jgi:hypothetical protein
MILPKQSVAPLLAGLLVIAAACEPRAPTSPGRAMPNAPAFTKVVLPTFPGPGAFVAGIDNLYYPLIVGTTFEYRAETRDGVETNTVTVTNQTKTILGVQATVVHDRVFLDGVLTEDTFDWYAQDVDGNVWYLGEQSCEIENGQCVSTEGSWEAGIDGAQPGIIMWADPAAQKPSTYAQEYLPGTAEDVAEVVKLDASVTTPYGSFSGCLETKEWSTLENASVEHKVYCPGTGLVMEIEGGGQRSQLVNIDQP